MEELLTVFVGDLALPFVKTDNASLSCFGGTASVAPGGSNYGPKPLHQVAFISSSELEAVCSFAEPEGIPLLYGLSYDGCLLKYRFSSGVAKIESVVPRLSSDDWPYPDYPRVLPRTPLRAGPGRHGARAEFATRWPQVQPAQEGECLVVVPPPKGLAYSLWGVDGASESATLLFHCAWATKTVVAENVCA